MNPYLILSKFLLCLLRWSYVVLHLINVMDYADKFWKYWPILTFMGWMLFSHGVFLYANGFDLLKCHLGSLQLCSWVMLVCNFLSCICRIWVSRLLLDTYALTFHVLWISTMFLTHRNFHLSFEQGHTF